MSGSLARKGFRFQDLYLLRRVLREAAEQLSHVVGGSVAVSVRKEAQFGIEASVPAPSSPTWDSVVAYDDGREVIEAKSGALSKADRVTFWRRLRRELNITDYKDTRVVLVVDPSSEETSKWNGLAAAAAAESSKKFAAKNPARVISAEDLLNEALWWMCSVTEQEAGSPPLSPTQAASALAAFRLESIAFDELEASVLETIELLFPDGLSDQLSDSILGWLNHRATAEVESRRLFSVRELLAEMGILQNCAAFDAGTIARWKDFWRELPALFVERARTRLGKAGQSISMGVTQPLIDEAQFGEKAKAEGAEVFRCNADAVAEEEVEELAKSLRFKRALLKIREPNRKMYALIDALDEAEIGLRTRWVKQLARLGVQAELNLAATIRDSTWRSDGTSQRQLKHWRELTVRTGPKNSFGSS